MVVVPEPEPTTGGDTSSGGGGAGSNGKNEAEFYVSGNGSVISPDWIVLSNASYGKAFDLGNGWYYRFDGAVAEDYYDHLHDYRSDGAEDYSQSFKDGGDHHAPKGGKRPPNSILKKLKTKTGYDWKRYRNEYFDEQLARLNVPSMCIIFPLGEIEVLSISALSWSEIIEWLTESPANPDYVY